MELLQSRDILGTSKNPTSNPGSILSAYGGDVISVDECKYPGIYIILDDSEAAMPEYQWLVLDVQGTGRSNNFSPRFFWGEFFAT